MGDKSEFKFWICSRCGYKKADPRPKSKAEKSCKRCGTKMYLSPKWTARVMVSKKVITKSFTRKEDAKAFIVGCKKAKDTGTVALREEKDVTWEQAVKNCLKWWKQAVVWDSPGAGST